MTGNYGNENAVPAPGDLPESFVKLHYTPPADQASQGKLEPVAWFTPFRDVDRSDLSGQGQDNFKDYDLGSAGPIPIPGMSLVLGAGKDGVLYVLDKDTAKFGKGSDYAVLKQPPLFSRIFPALGSTRRKSEISTASIPERPIICTARRLFGAARRMVRCCSYGAKTNVCAPGP
jgi:hypothetical protein